MNNDLISKAALVDEFEDYLLICSSGGFAMASEMLEAVREFPAVDAEPVRHGRWYQKRISVPKGKGQTYLVWACSLCHKHEKKRSDYCPNCGAEMDAEVEG